jgi:PBSX family phage portal protein
MVTQETGESFSKMQESESLIVKGVRTDSIHIEENIMTSNDEFAKSLDEYLKLGGLSHNFRRQAQRKLKKADNNELTGDASGSNQIIPDKYGYGLFDVVEPPYNMVALAKIYEVSPANYAAINAKAANIVGLGYTLEPSLSVTQRLEDITDPAQLQRARKKIERMKQEIADWLESRNDEETLTSILTKVFIDLEATGNGYIEIGRKNTGEIGYIGHVPCQNMRVRRLRDGFVQIQQGKAVFFRNFQDTQQANPIGTDNRPNEIIHLKSYTPTNTYYGIPAAVPAKNSIAGQEFASRYNLEYFENKAVPRYMVVLKGAKLSRESEAAIFEFFQNKLKGQSHRTVIVPLPADDAANGKVEMKLEAIENGIQDSSFNNYRKSTLEDILMAHRVPISKVATAGNVSIAAAKEFDRTFKEQVCRPMQDTLEKKINRIVAEKSDAFKLKFNELTLTDEDTQSKIDERYLRMKVVTPNEIRPRLGLPQMDGGDETVNLTGQQAAEQTAQATGNRLRDQERSANAGDSNTGARNAQGEGRQQA